MKHGRTVGAAVALVLLLGLVAAAGTGYSAEPQVDMPYILTTIGVGSGSSGAGPQGVGVDVVTGRVFVSNSQDNKVYVVDAGGTAVLGTVTTNIDGPAGVAVNATTRKVYVANSKRRSVVVINADTLAYVTEITGLGGNPQGIALDEGANRLYVTNFLNDPDPGQSVSIIDGAADTLSTNIVINDRFPYGIALDISRHRAYISARWGDVPNYVDVLDTELLSDWRYDEYPMQEPAGIVVRPSSGTVFVAQRYNSQGNPSLAVFDYRLGDEGKVLPWNTGLPLSFGGYYYYKPTGIAYNPFSDRVFVNAFESDAVVVVNAATLQVIGVLGVGDQPDAGIAVNPVISRVYVANRASGSLTVIQDGIAEPTPTPTNTPTPTATATPTPQPCVADGFETDNSPATARAIVPTAGHPQNHSFCGGSAPWYLDEDWVAFAAAGSSGSPVHLTMETSALTGDTDTMLTLYGPDNVTAKLASNDDINSSTLASRIIYDITESGLYYLHVTSLSPNEMRAKAERMGRLEPAAAVPQRDYVLTVTGGPSLANSSFLPVVIRQ